MKKFFGATISPFFDNPITTCTVGDGVLNRPNDTVSCTFERQNKTTINAQIVVGDQHAYQIRFNNVHDAEEALSWVKEKITSTLSSKEQQQLTRARVTPPPPRLEGGKYIFRLVGHEQLNALKAAAEASKPPFGH